jgi:molybdate-binding protein
VAEARGLAFLPLCEEHYDFAVADGASPAVSAFEAALGEAAAAVAALGFTPAGEA